MTKRIFPVIMAGGNGTGLWPLSRTSVPKQFVRIAGDKTLFQWSLLRVANEQLYEPPLIITNDEFRFLAAEQARELDLPLSAILLVPAALNTAYAVAAAATYVLTEFGEDALIQVLASDHGITVDKSFFEVMQVAQKTAESGKLVTVGIMPTEPSIGYGYIEIGARLKGGAHAVKRYIDKPTLSEAEKMLSKGGYFWNSGIFMFKALTLRSELERYAPEVLEAAQAAVEHPSIDLDFVRLQYTASAASESISFDYLVIERTTNSAVVPATFIWSDMGSWDAVWKFGAHDADDNVTFGRATLINTRGSLVISDASHLAVQGMQRVAVIASEDAVYVGRLSESQNVGEIVKQLASSKSTAGLTETHPTSYRPWGGYTSIFSGDRFQVKRLFGTPGKRLSLQKHHHRSEHWICVKGTAEVTIGDKVQVIRENESVYIPQGEVHRLANPGKILLEVIEVQTGSYLGEDDIIRIVDEFGRN